VAREVRDGAVSSLPEARADTTADPREPSSYPRRVLLAVTGLSPQVITETLYALSVKQTPVFIPTEVHLITTAEGAERARLALLSADPGWFARLCRDYSLPHITFDENCIHVLRDGQDEPLADIRTEDDNQRAADFITETVRSLTSDRRCALHVSIAGGRKTMGYYLGYALSLYGREQDRLSHVLVSEPFESSWEFFYPTPHSRVITTRDNKLADTAHASVTLADIPFVSLRHGLPEALLAGEASFNGTVEAARAAVGPAELVLDFSTRRIRAGVRAFRLPRAELALLALFAHRTIAGDEPIAAPPKGVPDRQWAALYLAELHEISDELDDLDSTERALRNGMDGDYFSMHLSKLRKTLRRELGPAAGPYLIDDGGTRPRRYRLALPPEAIRFGEIEDRLAGIQTRVR